ncbi:MAG: hypothetical protein HY290_00845 [Planctomycetia bacterium]|nr:hypothetical protein [Planctomycetia bacterium]
MTNGFYEGHRVWHVRDGLVGTVAGIEQPRGEFSSVATYQVKWDNGSFESRIDPSEITDLYYIH